MTNLKFRFSRWEQELQQGPVGAHLNFWYDLAFHVSHDMLGGKIQLTPVSEKTLEPLLGCLLEVFART